MNPPAKATRDRAPIWAPLLKWLILLLIVRRASWVWLD